MHIFIIIIYINGEMPVSYVTVPDIHSHNYSILLTTHCQQNHAYYVEYAARTKTVNCSSHLVNVLEVWPTYTPTVCSNGTCLVFVFSFFSCLFCFLSSYFLFIYNIMFSGIYLCVLYPGTLSLINIELQISSLHYIQVRLTRQFFFIN